MNRSNALHAVKAASVNTRNTARSFCTKVAAGFTALVAPMAAFAAADPAAAITTELAGIKASVGGILVVLAAVVGLMLLWAYIKRAK